MNRQYPATVDNLGPNLDDLAARAVEGDYGHTAIEAAPGDVSVTLALANTVVDTAVTFGLPFEAPPTVMVQVVSAANAGVYVNALAVSATTTGFTLRCASGAAQSIKCRWLAYGRRQ